RHFIVITQIIVACGTGARLDHLIMQQLHEPALRQPPLRPGRIDTGHQAGHGMGQDVISDTAVDAQRLADLVQFLIRAYPSYLQRPVTPRVDAGGFEVVPENTLAHYHSPALDRCRVPRTAGSGISGVRETEI